MSNERTTNGIPLRHARERAGLSQVALALRARCSPSTVSLAERGAISRRMARRFAEVLGISPADLLPPCDSEDER